MPSKGKIAYNLPSNNNSVVYRVGMLTLLNVNYNRNVNFTSICKLLIVLFIYDLSTLAIKMFGTGGLFMMKNAYVPEGRKKRGRVATPTSFSIINSYNIKSL